MQETTKNALFALFQAQNETAKAKTLKEIEAPILPPVKAEITQPQPETQKTPVAVESTQFLELSALTFNDLITPKEAPTEETATPTETPIINQISNFIEAVKPTDETENKPRVFISNYSKFSIAVTGETKQIKDVLKDLGGVYNRYLTCGAGWIFAKRKEAEILDELKLYATF
jgi:hypothetical protein